MTNRYVKLEWLSCALKVVLVSSVFVIGGIGSAAEGNVEPLSLDSFLRQVWSQNNLVQIRALEAAITDEQLDAERAIFDPAFVGQFEAVDRRRPNTAEQAANLSFATLFSQRNRTSQGAVELLAPRGARFRLGYTLSELNNNLNAGSFPDGEFVSTVGINVVQPLLKGAGKRVTLAGIRAAAINSDIGFQDYRRGMMEAVGQASIAYWELYQAQEQFGIAQGSLRTANELLVAVQKRHELGRASSLDVKQAVAGVALREVTLTEAKMRLSTARSRVLGFMGRTGDSSRLMVADTPEYRKSEPTFSDLWSWAADSNPTFVSLRQRADLDGLRVVVAKNSKLPQLDLSMGYGFSGIGQSASESLAAADDQDFPDWSIGLQLRVPFMGDQRAKHEFKAAQLREKAAQLGLDNFGNELENSLRSAIYTARTFRENGAKYRSIVEFRDELLKTQIARNEAGAASSHDVLEAEEDFFEVQVTAVVNAVQYQRAVLQLEVVAGTLLGNNGLDLSRSELRRRTEVLRRGKNITDERYQEFLKLANEEYQNRRTRKPSKGFHTKEEPGWFKWYGPALPVFDSIDAGAVSSSRTPSVRYNLSTQVRDPEQDVPKEPSIGDTEPLESGGEQERKKRWMPRFRWNGFGSSSASGKSGRE